MKSRTKILSLLLSLLLLVAVLPAFAPAAVPAKAARVIASGNCGFGGDPADVTWTLTDDRVLTFTGTGAMDPPSIAVTNASGVTENYALLAPGTMSMSEDILVAAMGYADAAALSAAMTAGQVALKDYYNTLADLYQTPVDSIVVGEGITELHYAALRFADVSSLSLPSTLVAIDDFALSEIRVDTLTVPAGVRTIGARAFAFSHIRSLVLNCASLTSVGADALASIRELKEIVVNDAGLDISDLTVPVVTSNFLFTRASDFNRYLEFNTVYQMLYQAPYIIDWANGTAARQQNIMTDLGCDAATAAAYDRFNTVPAFLDGFNRTFGFSFGTVNNAAVYCHDFIYNAIGVDIQSIEDVIADDGFTSTVNAALLSAYGVDVTAQTGGYVSNETCPIRDLHANSRVMLPWITVKAVCGSTPHAICVAAALPFASLGHNYGPWAETVAPTATAPGEEQRTCACGDTQTREIPALGETPADPQQESPNVIQRIIQFFLSLVNYFRRIFGIVSA